MAEIYRIDVAELPTQQEPQRHSCYLYVLQEAGESHFKIGIATHPARRLSALQGGNRRKLSIVAAYFGTRSDCFYIEQVALRFFKAPPGSEWVWVDSLVEITEFLDAFTVQA